MRLAAMLGVGPSDPAPVRYIGDATRLGSGEAISPAKRIRPLL
jgi:hypothetical protein